MSDVDKLTSLMPVYWPKGQSRPATGNPDALADKDQRRQVCSRKPSRYVEANVQVEISSFAESAKWLGP